MRHSLPLGVAGAQDGRPVGGLVTPAQIDAPLGLGEQRDGRQLGALNGHRDALKVGLERLEHAAHLGNLLAVDQHHVVASAGGDVVVRHQHDRGALIVEVERLVGAVERERHDARAELGVGIAHHGDARHLQEPARKLLLQQHPGVGVLARLHGEGHLEHLLEDGGGDLLQDDGVRVGEGRHEVAHRHHAARKGAADAAAVGGRDHRHPRDAGLLQISVRNRHERVRRRVAHVRLHAARGHGEGPVVEPAGPQGAGRREQGLPHELFLLLGKLRQVGGHGVVGRCELGGGRRVDELLCGAHRAVLVEGQGQLAHGREVAARLHDEHVAVQVVLHQVAVAVDNGGQLGSGLVAELRHEIAHVQVRADVADVAQGHDGVHALPGQAGDARLRGLHLVGKLQTRDVGGRG